MTLALLGFVLAWTCLAVAPGLSEPVKLAGLALAAGVLALQLPAGMLSTLGRNALLAYVASFALATALALEPDVAVFGTLARAQGLLAALALATLGTAAASLDRRSRERAYAAVAVLAGIVGLYALAQRLGLDPLQWTDAVAGRPAATLSNANALAGWLILALPPTLYLGWFATAGAGAAASAHHPAPAHLSAWRLLAVLQLLGLLASGTRSALIALAIAGSLVSLAHPRMRRWRWALALGLLLAIAGLAVLRPQSLQDRAQLWQSAAQAIAAPAALVDVHGHADRLARWRPLLGYGPDLQQAPMRAARAAAPARAEASGWQADRAHQLILDRWLESGLFGLFASAALVAAVAFALRRRYDVVADWPRGETLALACALGAWLVHLQLSFALTGDRTLAWVWIGFALAGNRVGATEPEPGHGAASGIWPLLLAAILFAGGAGCLRGGPAGEAERLFLEGQQRYVEALSAPDGAAASLIEAAKLFERAAMRRPYDTDAALAAASAWIETAHVVGDSAYIAFARRWLGASAAMDPRDPRIPAVRGRIEQVRASITGIPDA